MNETIRGHLKQRLRQAQIVLGAGLVLYAFFWLGATYPHRQVMGLEYASPYLRLAAIGVVLIGHFMLLRLRCPRCGNRVAITMFKPVLPTWCPICGVTFGEPMPRRPLA